MNNDVSELSTNALMRYVTVLPGWSIAVQLVIGAGILGIQHSLRGSHKFSIWNEYLCTLLWICWTLETSVIGFASSNYHANFSLFIRLLLWPLLSHNACVTPLNIVYLAVEEQSFKKIPRYLFIQLAAMATGLLFSSLSWRFMASWLSDIHYDFMSSRVNPFLNVSIVEGFLLELVMSLVSYLPRLFMKTGFKCTFTSAMVTCILILLLEHTTGAFMNPLTALSSVLLWHSTSLTIYSVYEMMIVYWMAPIIGTIMIARFDVWMNSQRPKYHVS